MDVLETSGDILQNPDRVIAVRIPPSTAVQPGSDGEDHDDKSISHGTEKEEQPRCFSC